jgi:hypothetical protein
MWLVVLLAGLPASRSLAQASAGPDAAPTSTELSVETDDSGTRTHAKFTARVSGESAHTGFVTLNDERGAIGSAALDRNGVATFQVNSLSKGESRIFATYSGSGAERASTSTAAIVNAQDTGLPGFNFALSPTALTVKAGTDGSLIATVTPTNGFTQLVSLSCSASNNNITVPLPGGVSCVFTPVNLVPSASGVSISSAVSILTTGVAGKTSLEPPAQSRTGRHLALAILFPGMVAFAGLGMARKRTVRLLGLTALLAIGSFGISSCAARYHYLHNPPAANFGTPPGTYTIVITASSNAGSTVIVEPMSLTLTVN